MFLNQLNNAEKECFVSLCVHAAKSNNVFDIKEKTLIQDYCREMGIVFFDSINTMPMEDIISCYINSDTRIKRIILLETLGLLYADGDFDKVENTFVTEFALKIGLSEIDIIKQIDLLEDYLRIVKDMSIAIEL